MDAAEFDAALRALATGASRRGLAALLSGGWLVLAHEGGTDAKKKKKKKKACKCGPCHRCVKGKCQMLPNGTICSDDCKSCLGGLCDPQACFGAECLPNRTCAAVCDPEIQDCQANCFCTRGAVEGSPYCTVDPRPACTTLPMCQSTANCQSGNVCQLCDGTDRCVPVC